MKTLEKFKSKNLPEKRVSRLEEFRTEIFELYEENYTAEQIIEYLAQQQVKVSVRYLYKFLNTEKKDEKQTIKPKVAQKKEPTKSEATKFTSTLEFLNKI